ncbi:MAG: phosphoglycerate kinase [Alphaproteobacteria bacterium]
MMVQRDYLTLEEIVVTGRRVLLRADLNVPVKNGKITDRTRLERLVPTIKYLRDHGARVAILSHFGRPDGKPVPEYSLRPIAAELAQILGADVAFASDCIGPEAKAVIDRLPQGGLIVLENTRFHAQEEQNDHAFAASLAALGDIAVMDAFSAAHRAHASTAGLLDLLPAAAGRLMQAELEALSKALETPQRPVAAIVGGAKVSTKLGVLTHLIDKVDMLALGGGMANTFLAAQGKPIGKSLYEADMLDTARDVMQRAAKNGCRLILPQDVVVAAEFKAGAASETVLADKTPADKMILDVGPATCAEIAAALAGCKTIVWNGPMGVFEMPPFDEGTRAIALTVAGLTQQHHIVSVAGGGETVAALAVTEQTENLTYVSTAGGAFLEWLEGKELPGVAALRHAKLRMNGKLSA